MSPSLRRCLSMTVGVRTSLTHPLRIATCTVGASGGAVGITFAPGKYQAKAMTGVWRRDLSVDLLAIRDWGATRLVSLLEPWEFEELAITELPARAQALGLCWHGLPITDGAVPDSRFLVPWSVLGPELSDCLQRGERVVVHCKGGLGRAGTVAALLLLAVGAARDGSDAIAQVRAVRPGAIETDAQARFVCAWR